MTVSRGFPSSSSAPSPSNLDKVKAFAIGGVDYITKPFQMEELHARVETHLKLRRLQIELEETQRATGEGQQPDVPRPEGGGKDPGDVSAPRRASRSGQRSSPGVYRPCDELAGDGLNIIPLGDGKVGLYILDVSGHGVASALLSVTLSRLLSPPSDPSSILIRERRRWRSRSRSRRPLRSPPD